MNLPLKLFVIFFLMAVGINAMEISDNSKKQRKKMLTEFVDQYNSLTLDEGLSKFINDMEYLKIILPILINLNDTVLLTNTYGADTEVLDAVPLFSLSTDSLTAEYLIRHMQISQIAIENDSSRLNLSFNRDKLKPGMFFNPKVFLNKAYYRDGAILEMDNVSPDNFLVKDRTKMDSIAFTITFSYPNDFDVFVLSRTDSLITHGQDSIKLVELNENGARVLIPNTLFTRFIEGQTQTLSGNILNSYSNPIVSAAMLAEHQEMLGLLDKLSYVAKEAKEVSFKTKEDFINSLANAIARVEPSEIESYNNCTFYFYGIIDKLYLYFGKDYVDKEIVLTVPVTSGIAFDEEEVLIVGKEIY